LASLSAKTCQPCHAEIYVEWADSRMGRAFTESIFQADWAHQNNFYYCLSCHAPLESQQPTVVTGLSDLKPLTEISTPNPIFDPALQAEGVTCVVCHLEEGALVGPHEVDAPHATRADPQFAGADRCERCHQMPLLPLTRADRPLADTHGEWKEWKRVTGRVETCTDCHMPEVERASATGAPTRIGRRHSFPGGWDDAFVKTGFELGEMTRGPDGIRGTLTNLAGHRFPTADPSRALILTARFFDAQGNEVAKTEHRIERKVRLPAGKELGDNTLRPGEKRAVLLPLKDTPPERVARATVTLDYDRLANLEIAHPLQLTDRRVELAKREVNW
jgi:hypothetical protein